MKNIKPKKVINSVSKKVSDYLLEAQGCLVWWGEPDVSEELHKYYNEHNSSRQGNE